MSVRPCTLKLIRPRSTAQAAPRARGTTDERGYDGDWERLRAQFLMAHPLCQCEQCDDGRKRVTAANVVNHIIDIRDDPGKRLEWSNLQSMAKRCHDRHTKLRQLAAMRAQR
jgi:5-methylcytosine-specific restriction protein A